MHIAKFYRSVIYTATVFPIDFTQHRNDQTNVYKRNNINIYIYMCVCVSLVYFILFSATHPVGCTKTKPSRLVPNGKRGAYITVLMAAIIIVIDGTGRLHHRPLAHTPPPPAVKNSFGLPFDGLILPSIRRL